MGIFRFELQRFPQVHVGTKNHKPCEEHDMLHDCDVWSMEVGDAALLKVHIAGGKGAKKNPYHAHFALFHQNNGGVHEPRPSL